MLKSKSVILTDLLCSFKTNNMVSLCYRLPSSWLWGGGNQIRRLPNPLSVHTTFLPIFANDQPSSTFLRVGFTTCVKKHPSVIRAWVGTIHAEKIEPVIYNPDFCNSHMSCMLPFLPWNCLNLKHSFIHKNMHIILVHLTCRSQKWSETRNLVHTM